MVTVHPSMAMVDWTHPDYSDSLKQLTRADRVLVVKVVDVTELHYPVVTPKVYKVKGRDGRTWFMLEEVGRGVGHKVSCTSYDDGSGNRTVNADLPFTIIARDAQDR